MMIEAKNLMVGDWIMYDYYCPQPSDDYPDEDWRYLKIESISKLTELENDHNWAPVCLTKDILSKNGFYKGEGFHDVPYTCEELSELSISVFIADEDEENKFWSIGDGDEIFIVVKYVHELQHFLKLFEINKEIQL